MKGALLWMLAAALGLVGPCRAAPAPATATATAARDPPDKGADAEERREAQRQLKDASGTTAQSISVGGRTRAYRSEAGVLVVHVEEPRDGGPAPAAADEAAFIRRTHAAAGD